jgi:outer membrane protein TolC
MQSHIMCRRDCGRTVNPGVNSPYQRGVRAVRATPVALLLLISAVSAPSARAADAEPKQLGIEDAAALAVESQPLLESQRSAVAGTRESAIAAAQLPDPVLVGEIADFPVGGADSFSLRRDPFTQYMLGIRQEFPGGRKRALRAERVVAEADRLETELRQQELVLQRAVRLAWLAAWGALSAQGIVRTMIADASDQAKLIEIGYRAGKTSQADLSAARVAVGLLEDTLDELKQKEIQARNEMRRWIGNDADRPIKAELPEWPESDVPELLRRLERHPHVAAQAKAVDVASAELKLAREEYRPDWSVRVAYGYRPDFSDMAGIEFEIALPFFTRNRQDRTVQARAADVRRAELLQEDALREHRAAVHINAANWDRLQGRLGNFDRLIVPGAQQRLDAAMMAYAAGSGSLSAVLDARRSLLDVRLQRLELEVEATRNRIELLYLSDAGTGETPL